MDKTDINALAKNMIESVRAFVARSEAVLGKRLDELDAKLSSIPAGPKGDKGEDAEVDVALLTDMITASVRAAVSALPAAKQGDKGGPGAKGDAGESIRGERGERGDNGKDVDQLAVKAMVGDEVKQAVAAIPKPQNGKDGDHGKDAAELEVLPSIDEVKSYRRGTWASHNGGLIRAARQTDAVKDGAIIKAGWVVMVEGVAAVVVTQGDDPRAIEVAAMLTSGTKAVSAFHVPMIIDRGVWREGPHEKGDHVTWDGSGWIAQKATTDKPGTSDAFRLSTKRGRDGKDGGGNPGGSAPSAPVRLR